MSIALIYARSQNGYIGKDGKLLFQDKTDMAFFRNMTMGHSVLMGRKTWESLPDAHRPLKGRDNYVLSRDKNYVAKGAFTIIPKCLPGVMSPEQKLFVIGGAEIYDLYMPFADTIYETIAFKDCEGDTLAPVIDEAKWKRECGSMAWDGEESSFLLNIWKKKFV